MTGDLFIFQQNGHQHQVAIRTRRIGNDWIASAVLLPKIPNYPEKFLRSGTNRIAVQVRSECEREAAERMAFILESVYGCSRLS
jgi:hypothetical protein